MATDNSSALTGALGAVLGYLGSEVAEVVLFERLFWPERYYNDLSIKIALQQTFLMTMGGPLHAAALKALDTFRENGLYMGTARGDMLGTAFFADKHIKYSVGMAGSQSHETRNAFWIEVIRLMPRTILKDDKTFNESSNHGQDNDATSARQVRAFSAVYILELGVAPRDKPFAPEIHPIDSLELGAVPGDESPTQQIECISEDTVTWKTFVCIFLSESIAIGVGIGALFLGVRWMIIVMAIPLLLKTISAALSVRREGLQSLEKLQERGSMTDLDFFNISMPPHGFLLVKGPAPLVQQFFKHYGHPERKVSRFQGNRFREVLAMVLLYCFVFYFPAGLVFTIWLNAPVQYLWLAYQLYAVLAMHVVRLLDWQGAGRTEARVAKSLSQGRTVWLQWPGGATVSVKLERKRVAGIAEGRERVQNILHGHYGVSENNVGSSQFTPQGTAASSENRVSDTRVEPGATD